MTLWKITNVCEFADWPITNPLFFVTLFLIEFVPDNKMILLYICTVNLKSVRLSLARNLKIGLEIDQGLKLNVGDE